MDKTKQLLIRACKSKDPYKRLHSVYRRFYLFANEEEANFHLAALLTGICDAYAKPRTSALISDLHPDNWFKVGAEPTDCYWKVSMLVLANYVRLSGLAAFPGLTEPAPFRGKDYQYY